MPMMRPSTALRASRALSTNAKTSSPAGAATAAGGRTKSVAAAASFSTSRVSRAGDHAHEEHYEPPSGWLFGVKPGEKYEKEGWENIMIYGFFGSLGLGVAAWCFKPDTSIQTWALEEARRRLEAEGILKEPESKS
ncbi:MAG: hypothetical protein M1818_005213 [Claussenomyces sp. TS43310]|nr:MAG: hypothetical protein M1818_005213 [Claussenomyces sp. TS43310]